MKFQLLIPFLFMSMLNSSGQEKSIPIGAQVYIEPGQSNEDISQWFGILKSQGMNVCRIRIDETHLKKGSDFDFTLYDHAFDAADQNGIEIFATLFPAESNPEGVGGFKFPESNEHLLKITNYISLVVNHFKDHPALQAWVLQNEPGSISPPETPFTRQKFKEWKTQREALPIYNGYIRKHHLKADFLREYTSWYLSWIANEIRRYDPKTELHVNNHMIFETLPEYDFPKWKIFLNHLGASMHPSWHFGYFKREEYPFAISANCNIMHTSAKPLPFWVTELQGGNNNFSGYNPLMPSPEEISQWMLCSIFRGARGIIFWTLNPRSVGFEAGEWGMIDFQNRPTERLQSASEIISLLKNHPQLASAKTVEDDIYILYSKDAMYFQRMSQINSSFSNQAFDARQKGAHIKSVLGIYRAYLSIGYHPQINSLENMEWEKTSGTIILPNMVILPRKFYPKIRTFVKNGGKLIFTGQSGHLDEYQYNVMQKEWPLKDLFGAELKEFEMKGERFFINLHGRLTSAHYMQGKLKNESAQTIAFDTKENVLGISNKYGLGRVYWIPSMLGLGYWKWRDPSFPLWLKEVSSESQSMVHLDKNLGEQNILIHHLQSSDNYYSLLINKSQEKLDVQLKHEMNKEAKIIFQLKNSVWKDGGSTLAPEEVMVLEW